MEIFCLFLRKCVELILNDCLKWLEGKGKVAVSIKKSDLNGTIFLHVKASKTSCRTFLNMKF